MHKSCIRLHAQHGLNGAGAQRFCRALLPGSLQTDRLATRHNSSQQKALTGHAEPILVSRQQSSAVDQATACSRDRTSEASTSTEQPATSSSPPSFHSRKGLMNKQGQLGLKNLTYEELEQWCIAMGERPQRAKQLWRWMYYNGNYIRSLDCTAGRQGGFSDAFRQEWRDKITLCGGLSLREVHTAADGTRKMVFNLLESEGASGAGVEAVIIPVERAQGNARPRTTLCVSSQVGCAQNCQFCFTGRMGLLAQLSTAQIVEQVVEARRYVAEHNRRVAAGTAEHAQPIAPITNIVFMGMGESLHNFGAVSAALQILCHGQGLQFSPNKVTVSTVGLIPEMRALAATSTVQLAVSLHATTDEVRSWIVPVNRRYPLSELMAALEDMYPMNAGARARAGRHVLFEYVMLRGVNDTLEDAARLLRLTQRIECKFNLIVFNAHAGTRFQASTQEQVVAFQAAMKAGGAVCTVRDSRGDDEMAACGQLGNLDQLTRQAPILKPPARLRDVLAVA